MAPNKLYDQIPHERYEILRKRYEVFLSVLTDPDKDAVSIFDPLGEKLQEELQLIRKFSEELQRKKEDDLRKAQEAAEEAEAEAKTKEESEIKEESETKEESKEVTEKTTEKVEN